MAAKVWRYEHVTLDRIVDGDTVHLVLDLGFFLTRASTPYRLARIDAPELSTPEGLVSKMKLGQFLDGKTLRMDSVGPDKYGRWLIELFACDPKAVNVWYSVNQWLLDNGFAVPMK